MRSSDADFFWLGYTPCRTVLLVGMVVAVQVYDKRAVYTIDDGTAVIDCVLRHPPPPRPTGNPKSNDQRLSPRKPRLDKAKAVQSMEPPPPITEPGYPVRVVGKVVRHYQSKQIHADSIDLCPSSLDEIAHLERVIELHKTKYSLAIPFVPPPKPTSHALPVSHVDANVFSDPSRTDLNTTSYTLPAPPRMPMPLQDRNRPPPVPILDHTTCNGVTHAPSSPTAFSVASSTPSSPCKPSSPAKAHEAPGKPKLRHPSRLHTRDLTANTFRLYIKHYMDNAPSPFLVSCQLSPSRSTCGDPRTPTKRTRFGEGDDVTPRPRPHARTDATRPSDADKNDDGPTLGFTLSHLRRVPELALLAARVVRAETRKRDKAERDRAKTRDRQDTCPASASSKPNGRTSATELPRKKIKRLFAWAVVKLYEEGSIVLWDGEVRPLPVPPPPGEGASGMWQGDSVGPSVLDSTCGSASSWALYNLSASASLYSHYHAPRQRDGGASVSVSVVDVDADPAELSDPGADEEAYVPLNPRYLAEHVREAIGALRHGGRGGTKMVAEDVLTCMQRTDSRWARVGVWAVEEALALLRAG